MVHRRVEPGPGQESVWDYPRPPRLEDSSKHVQIVFQGVVIADSQHAKRVLETSQPPAYYIPPTDLQLQYFTETSHQTYCEWKGMASYYTINVADHSLPMLPGTILIPLLAMRHWLTMWLSILAKWMLAISMAKRYRRRRAISMAAGSRKILSDPSRADPVPGVGNRHSRSILCLPPSVGPSP